MAPREHDDLARAGMYAGQYMVDGLYAQLLGLCRGLLCDGELRDSEIVALDQWLAAYGSHLPDWPARDLAARVKGILRDGEVDEGERADLQAYLERASGVEGTERFTAPTSLPLDRPLPLIEYEGRVFCLTGTFVYGPRRKVAAAIAEWGGRVSEATVSADYLVIGATITAAWKYGNFGLKILEATELKANGHRIRIVSEDHWSTSLC